MARSCRDARQHCRDGDLAALDLWHAVIAGERLGGAVATQLVALSLPLVDAVVAIHPLLGSISDTLLQHGAVRRRNLGLHVMASSWVIQLLAALAVLQMPRPAAAIPVELARRDLYLGIPAAVVLWAFLSFVPWPEAMVPSARGREPIYWYPAFQPIVSVWGVILLIEWLARRLRLGRN
jgi:hypothetical protein